MWKKYIASLMMTCTLTPVFTVALYLHQSYSTKFSAKVVTAASLETFDRKSSYSLINQSSPFQKMPTQNAANMPSQSSQMPPKTYTPIPSSPPIFPQAGGSIGRIPAITENRAEPNVKSIIYSPNGGNIAILADGSTDFMVETGQTTKWGNVGEITEDSIQIGGKVYKTKTM